VRHIPKYLFPLIIVIVLVFVGPAGAFAGGQGEQGGASTRTDGESAGNAEDSNGIPPLDPQQDVEITFYSYNLATTDIGASGTGKLIREFEEQHPNVTIDAVGIPWTEILSRTQADIVAGNPPDVAQLVFNDLSFIADNLNAVPLERIVSDQEWAEYQEGFHPRGLALTQIGDLTYGATFTFSTPVLYYNATLFEEAGLDPDDPPATMAEVEEAALQIVERTGKGGAALYSPSWIAQSLVMSNGGRMLSEDRRRLMFGEAEAVEAMTVLQDLVESGAHINQQEVNPAEMFVSGNLGMWLITSAFQNTMIQSAEAGGWELQNTTMPSYGDKPTKPVNSGSALFILAPDPVKQRAAWEFVKSVTSKRGYTIIASEIGYLPLRPAIVNNEDYLAGWVEENPLVEPNLAQLDRLTPWVSYPGPNYRQIESIITEAQERVVFAGADPQETLQAAQERAQSLMPR
jgi:multiple sugar transport system substrate-binding protein